MHNTLNLNRFTECRNEIFCAATFTLRPQYATTLKLLRELLCSKVFQGTMNGFVLDIVKGLVAGLGRLLRMVFE